MNNFAASSPLEECNRGEPSTAYGDRWENKRKIEQLFRKNEKLWYSDIAERLKLDLKLVVELCEELEKEGKIEGIK